MARRGDGISQRRRTARLAPNRGARGRDSRKGGLMLADLAPDVLQVVREILRQEPGTAARVACPDCGRVLAEYLYGVARYTCRRCQWQGVIVRTGPATEQEVRTLRSGRRRDGREEG